MNAPYQYEGDELRLFAKAVHWKRYLREQLAPYLHGRVLEVGAGMGGSTVLLCNETVTQWVCLEPDAALLDTLTQTISVLPNASRIATRTGTIASLSAEERFDAVLYLDVLEHIKDDREELLQAAKYLASGGSLLVLSPAHPWLYTPFDRAIGHHRRYTRNSLAQLTPEALRLEAVKYLDAVGLLASLGNRLLLRQSMPTERQIAVWDGWLVPLSRRVDSVLGFRVGKSVLGIWRAP